jgi:hypothetical protein
MFIVVEGTDASGKTSLIEAIYSELQSRYPGQIIQRFHKGKPADLTRRWVLNDYVNSIETTNWSESVALSDRWHWGEITYAPKYRPVTNKDGYGLLGKAGWRWVELFMQSRGIAQYWLYQPLDVIEARLEARGDEFVEVKDLRNILAQYEIANSVSIIRSKVQPPAQSLEKINSIAKFIINDAEHVAKCAKPLAEFPYYIGAHKPSILLVGDRHNTTARYGKETNLPFMPVDGNSGEYLMNALPDDLWKNVGIVNINDGQNWQSFEELWKILGTPPVAVLGRLAEKTLSKVFSTSLPYAVLPHPQFVRRFANNHQVEYGEAIARLSENTMDKEDKWILR